MYIRAEQTMVTPPPPSNRDIKLNFQIKSLLRKWKPFELDMDGEIEKLEKLQQFNIGARHFSNQMSETTLTAEIYLFL